MPFCYWKRIPTRLWRRWCLNLRDCEWRMELKYYYWADDGKFFCWLRPVKGVMATVKLNLKLLTRKHLTIKHVLFGGWLSRWMWAKHDLKDCWIKWIKSCIKPRIWSFWPKKLWSKAIARAEMQISSKI
jgi:hypothetical protein